MTAMVVLLHYSHCEAVIPSEAKVGTKKEKNDCGKTGAVKMRQFCYGFTGISIHFIYKY